MSLGKLAHTRANTDVSPSVKFARGHFGFVLFLLAAFFLQGFATQVHVHGLPLASWAQTPDGAYTVHTPDTGEGAPADEANCPLCQAAHAAGHYLLPAAFALPTILWIAADRIAPTAPENARVVSHHWRGRAPPTAR